MWFADQNVEHMAEDYLGAWKRNLKRAIHMTFKITFRLFSHSYKIALLITGEEIQHTKLQAYSESDILI
jgi:hypothetical protein